MPAGSAPLAVAPGPAAPPNVNVRRAFSVALQQPGGIKRLSLAGLISIVPVLGTLVISGWQNEIAARLRRQSPEPLPEWKSQQLTSLARNGVAAMTVRVFALALVGGVGYVTLATFYAILVSSWLASVSAGVGVTLLCVALVHWVAGSLGLLVYQALITRAELGASLASAARPIAAWRYARAGLGRQLRAWWTWALFSTCVLGLGIVACGIGVIPALIIIRLAATHLRWQLYQQYRHRGGGELLDRPVDAGLQHR